MIPVWKYEDKHEADAEWISVVYFLVLNLLLCSSSILCIKHTIVVVYGTFVWIMRESLALSLWSEALPCTSIGVWGAPRFIPQSGRNCLTLFSRFPEQFHALHSMSFPFYSQVITLWNTQNMHVTLELWSLQIYKIPTWYCAKYFSFCFFRIWVLYQRMLLYISIYVDDFKNISIFIK